MTNSAEQAVVTLWFVSAPDAHALLASNPQPDADYGLQLVAGLFPDKPVTQLGTFPLTRSAPAGHTEVYVGTYPGVTVLQTAAIPFTCMLDLVPEWIQPDAADDIYAFAQGPSGTFAGFAHWHRGKLERAFSATACEILEDKGLPLGVEGPYWAGQYPVPKEIDLGSDFAMPLPFLPGDMLLTLYTAWLGFEPRAHHLNILVNGFAIDGRPEARPMERSVPADDAVLQSPEMGTGVSADELAAAELEEATGEVSDQGEDDAAANRERSDRGRATASGKDDAPHKDGLWARFKRWWNGEPANDDADDATDEEISSYGDYTPDIDEDGIEYAPEETVVDGYDEGEGSGNTAAYDDADDYQVYAAAYSEEYAERP